MSFVCLFVQENLRTCLFSAEDFLVGIRKNEHEILKSVNEPNTEDFFVIVRTKSME